MSIVLANGVFDLLHVGHLRYLTEARSMGRWLAVGVTRDKFVGKTGRPIIPEEERLEMVFALECVSEAFLCDDSIEALEKIKPDIFVKGHDYVEKGLLKAEIEFCEEHGVKMKHTKPNPQTTSAIIERIKCLG